MSEPWGDKENKLVAQYFKCGWTPFTLYKKIHAINPGRTLEAVTRKVREFQAKGWHKDTSLALEKLRVGYLDIEATNLKGNFGFILSWFIKAEGENKYFSSVITKKEIFDEHFDRRLIVELLSAFNKFDVLYTHYGSDYRFDFPFIRTRAYRHNLQKDLPSNGEKFIMDTYDTAKKKLKLHSNRLGVIAEAVGIHNVKKTPLEPTVWQKASVGNKEALEYIALHNKRDVQLLERVHQKLKQVEERKYRSV